MMVLCTMLAGCMSSHVFAELSMENPHPAREQKPPISPVSKIKLKNLSRLKKLFNFDENNDNKKRAGQYLRPNFIKTKF